MFAFRYHFLYVSVINKRYSVLMTKQGFRKMRTYPRAETFFSSPAPVHVSLAVFRLSRRPLFSFRDRNHCLFREKRNSRAVYSTLTQIYFFVKKSESKFKQAKNNSFHDAHNLSVHHVTARVFTWHSSTPSVRLFEFAQRHSA